MRLHTQFVRNWGYYGDVVSICGELYAPLDDELRRLHGFAASELLATAAWLVRSLEEKMTARMNRMRRFIRERSIPRIVRRYFAVMTEIDGDPESFLRAISSWATPEGVIAELMGHADVQLPRFMLASASEVASSLGVSEDAAARILSALSLRPGALAGREVDHFLLENPIWRAPGLKVGDEYFFAMPQSIFSHIHEIMRDLFSDQHAHLRLSERRSRYLEEKARATLARVLPGAAFRPNYLWRSGSQEFETDLIVTLDRTVLIVECKSAALSRAGLRGAPDRVKRHVRELVVDPSIQSARLASQIRAGVAGDTSAAAGLPDLGVPIASIRTVVLVSVTLDDFSVLASSELDLRSAGWVPDGLDLALTLNISDLLVVADVLDQAALFIHYFSERERFQKSVAVFGDELDFLGFYLSTGFNVGQLESKDTRLAITGMSAPLDQYYASRDAGVRLAKPKPRLCAYFCTAARRHKSSSAAQLVGTVARSSPPREL